MVAKFATDFTSKSTSTTINTKSKTALQEQMSKDPNTGIFTDTSGRVSETLNLNWSRIYLILDNDNLSTITQDQFSYVNNRNCLLHAFSYWPHFMSYTNSIKWELDHTNPKE